MFEQNLATGNDPLNQLWAEQSLNYLIDKWKLRPLQAQRLIGRTKKDIGTPLDVDALLRLHLVKHIAGLLQRFLPQHGNDRRWLKASNSYFLGDSPLKSMTDSYEGAHYVYFYLLAMLNGK
jgi:hypothetical protein